MGQFWTTFIAAGVPIALTFLLSRLFERKPKVCFVRGAKHVFSTETSDGKGGKVNFTHCITFLIVANRGSKPATGVCVNLSKEPFKWQSGVHGELNKNHDESATIKLPTLAPAARVTINFALRPGILGPGSSAFQEGYAESVTFNEGTAKEVEAILPQEHPAAYWLFIAAGGGAMLALLIRNLLG